MVREFWSGLTQADLWHFPSVRVSDVSATAVIASGHLVVLSGGLEAQPECGVVSLQAEAGGREQAVKQIFKDSQATTVILTRELHHSRINEQGAGGFVYQGVKISSA
jgi:hypothetical protein